jgi:hypothetical protein
MKFNMGASTSRCQIQNSLAMLEVCWDRHVIVHNRPGPVDSPEARCPTHPQIGNVTASHRTFQMASSSHAIPIRAEPKGSNMGTRQRRASPGAISVVCDISIVFFTAFGAIQL